MNTRPCLALVLLPVVALTACRLKEGGPSADDPTNDEPMTTGEARAALEEAAASTEASNVMATTVEMTTDFTIGGAVQHAAEELKNLIASQLPCADVSLQDATLTLEYGVNPGNCTYKGHTLSGKHVVSVSKNDNDDVLVEHTWENLSNGTVSVSGMADVTWSFTNKTRHVVHELSWTRLSDGRVGVGSGDRTQTPLDGGVAEGFREDGSRQWAGQAGTWDLSIEGVEMRWADPVPQAGQYALLTPKNKLLTLGFSRVDDDTIRVTVTNGARQFQFDVSKSSGVQD